MGEEIPERPDWGDRPMVMGNATPNEHRWKALAEKQHTYILHLEGHMCLRCHNVPWSLGQMDKCDECVILPVEARP